MTRQRLRFGARQTLKLLQNLTIVQTVYLTSKSIDYNIYILKILLLETTNIKLFIGDYNVESPKLTTDIHTD